MNSLRLIVFIATVFILDQIILSFSGVLTVNLAVPVVVFVSTRGNFPRSLITAFALGFLSDMTALRTFPVMAIYFTLIAVVVDLMSRRYVEFKSVVAMYIITAVLCVLQIILLSLLYVGTLTIVSFYSIVINSVVGIIMVLFLRNIFRKEVVGE